MAKDPALTMRKALVDCAARFGEYEQAHAAKRTQDGYAKAARNAEMREMCEEAIAIWDNTQNYASAELVA